MGKRCRFLLFRFVYYKKWIFVSGYIHPFLLNSRKKKRMASVAVPNTKLNTKSSMNEQRSAMESLNRRELAEADNASAASISLPHLYPSLDDPHFNAKIALKKEFNDTKYDGAVHDVRKHAKEQEENRFELLPQQAFVRNFMSMYTPYNSLLLFHGLGSGKTCSAIGVCEEMRDYMRQMGIHQKILIVTSPNVQTNFKQQLFDDRTLKNVNGQWTVEGCIGNKLLNEINPTNMKGLDRDRVILLVKRLINTWYDFMGYIQFSNEISAVANGGQEGAGAAAVSMNEKVRNLQAKYANSLIVVDEVHNIRIFGNSEAKAIAKNLMFLVSVVPNIRMLLLSATPMFNSHTEIIWLLNLMNANDRRSVISVSDVFDKNGHWKKDENGVEIGKKVLMEKATGYISYIRGENPYTFPYRVYADRFAPERTFRDSSSYPHYQMNGCKITEHQKMRHLSVFLTAAGTVQQQGYNYIVGLLRQKEKARKAGISAEELANYAPQSYKYTDLQLPIEALNIVYPHPQLEQMAHQYYFWETSEVEEKESLNSLTPSATTVTAASASSVYATPGAATVATPGRPPQIQSLQNELEELRAALESAKNATANATAKLAEAIQASNKIQSSRRKTKQPGPGSAVDLEEAKREAFQVKQAELDVIKRMEVVQEKINALMRLNETAAVDAAQGRVEEEVDMEGDEDAVSVSDGEDEEEEDAMLLAMEEVFAEGPQPVEIPQESGEVVPTMVDMDHLDEPIQVHEAVESAILEPSEIAEKYEEHTVVNHGADEANATPMSILHFSTNDVQFDETQFPKRDPETGMLISAPRPSPQTPDAVLLEQERREDANHQYVHAPLRAPQTPFQTGVPIEVNGERHSVANVESGLFPEWKTAPESPLPAFDANAMGYSKVPHGTPEDQPEHVASVAAVPVRVPPFVASAVPGPVVDKASAPCPPGMERNPDTRRCNKVCPPGMVRNRKTRKCVKPCPTGQDRNDDGKCVNIVWEGNHANPEHAPLPPTPPAFVPAPAPIAQLDHAMGLDANAPVPARVAENVPPPPVYVPQIAPRVRHRTLKDCKPGQERNRKTNRCVKICPPGFIRNDDSKCVIDHTNPLPPPPPLAVPEPGFQPEPVFEPVARYSPPPVPVPEPVLPMVPPVPPPRVVQVRSRSLKDCKPDQERNPKTNRCIKRCPTGYERDLEGKCVRSLSPAQKMPLEGDRTTEHLLEPAPDVVEELPAPAPGLEMPPMNTVLPRRIRPLKACAEGQERNPKTNRCIKRCAPGYRRNSDGVCVPSNENERVVGGAGGLGDEFEEEEGDGAEYEFEEEGEDEEGAEAAGVEMPLAGGMIDPKSLVGMAGLRRVMRFTETKTPLFKGHFEYLPNVPRIFARTELANYSAKMDAICNYIYNPKTKQVAEGIIIIYSAYIDGGVIPMALALEEMGFSRYPSRAEGGGGTHSLFKAPPVPQVDVRTMQPPINKRDFRPARYAMITGDKRLSPNNAAELKAATSANNIENGDQIKVVLITQAGSEGLDFKGIRQVHILDPWFNMNRIEQIIGRGVRNGSHRTLPFEKRNVQIFLHGTMLSNPEEEAADLYMYRKAEHKATIIGKVSRVLKQMSVDCIIHHEQSKLTAERFHAIPANQNITQVLSDHQTLTHFKVGDFNESVTCDFMSCDYSCWDEKSLKKWKSHQDNESTYTEQYMLVSADKIINRIRALMKQRFFYKKATLLQLLNSPKPYPLSQIYGALTQMVGDNAVLIQDKYGRNGRLVNIGEYYLFQPVELNNAQSVSVYERSAPLEVKPSAVQISFSTMKKGDIPTIMSAVATPVASVAPSPDSPDSPSLSDSSDSSAAVAEAAEADANVDPDFYSTYVRRSTPSTSSTSSETSVSRRKQPAWRVEYENKRQESESQRQHALMITNGRMVMQELWEEYWTAIKTYRTLEQVATAEAQAQVQSAMVKSNSTWNVYWGKVGLQLVSDSNPDLLGGALTKEEKYAWMRQFLVDHIVESTMMRDNVFLLNYLYSKTFEQDMASPTAESAADWMEFASDVKKRWMAKTVTVKDTTGVIMFDGPSRTENIHYFVLNSSTNMWSNALSEDKKDLSESLVSLVLPKYVPNSSELNDNIGFIGFEPKREYMIYKVKNMTNARSTGYSCALAGKAKVVEFMNRLENTDRYHSKMRENPLEMCVRQELLMRAFNKQKKDGKVWFVSTEVAIFNEFERKDKSATATKQ